MSPKEITLQVCNGTRMIKIQSKYVLGMKCGILGHKHDEPCQDCVKLMPKKEQHEYIDAVDDLDGAKLYLEGFGVRIEDYATIPGYKSRSSESQESKDAEMAQAKQDLARYRRKAADEEELMDVYKKKYVVNHG